MWKKTKKNVFHLLLPFIKVSNLILWRIYLLSHNEIKIIVGSGTTKYKGWFATDIHILDLTNENDFKKFFLTKKIDNIVAEHVLEHLSQNALELMLGNFVKYTSQRINIRIAVPDGFHSDSEYINKVKPGGVGEGAQDHKNLFNYKSLSELFSKHGFKVNIVEYWDETGQFHSNYKNNNNGYISRCLINDERNVNNKPIYTSLIIDFKK